VWRPFNDFVTPSQPPKRQDSSSKAGTSTAQPPERRRSPRTPFTAGVVAVEPRSQTEIDAHTTDLSASGCYVDTMSPLPAQTEIDLRLTRNGKSFHTKARVMYCQSGVGMGLLFTEIAPQERPMIERWFAELRGESVPEPQPAASLEPSVVASPPKIPNPPRTDEQAAIEELVSLLMEKHVVTEDEGEAILRRLRLSAEL